jgi:hypothetical protein
MHVTSVLFLALSGAASAQVAHMMRFACSQLTVERLDPLVNPGLVGTPHTHQIVGGNSFRPEMMPVEYDMVNRSTCTSCTFSEDFRHVFLLLLLRKINLRDVARAIVGEDCSVLHYAPLADHSDVVTTGPQPSTSAPATERTSAFHKSQTVACIKMAA